MTPEELIATQKAQFEAMFDMVTKTMESMEKLVKLSMQTVKETLQDSAEEAMTKLSAKDLQGLTAKQAQWMEPVAEKMLAYAQHVHEIASGAQADIAKTAEAQVAEMHRKFMALVESSAKSAPAGSEPAVALMKSALENANMAYEAVRQASKKAADMAETSLRTATGEVGKAAQHSAARAKRKT
ncbi:MAG: TIGR01841 family phasin [Proteobacteria bacterium]|nr:TIGR01841 family phasin [Pseudomonadota bacterium]